MNEPNMKWQSKLSRPIIELNSLLREASKEGVFPAVRIHRNDRLFGFGIQVIEISCVLGIVESGLTPLALDEGYYADLPGDSTPEDLSGLGAGSTPALRQ